MNIKLKTIVMASLMALAGSAHAQDCLNGTREIIRFNNLSDTQVEVVQSSYHRYVLYLDTCPALKQASTLGFATGPQRSFIHNGQLLYANPVDGAQRICGRAGDRLVIREKFKDVRDPSQSCRIVGVSRLRD